MQPSAATLSALWRAFERGDEERLARMLCKLVRAGVEGPLSLFSDHPLADDWSDFAHASVSNYLRKRQGIVYVVANPSMTPPSVSEDLSNPKNPIQGWYKIGVTGFDVNKRIRSLRTAGVVGDFIEIDSASAIDRFAAETAAHRRMRAIAPRHKEFFVTDHATATKAMRESVDQDNYTMTKAFGISAQAHQEASK